MSNPFTSNAGMVTDAAAAMNPTPPPTMPDPLSPDAMAARRRAEEDAMGRAGRQSTILSTALNRGKALVGGATGSTTGSTPAGTSPVATSYAANKLGSSA